jgi:YVTN family beta-propeller protein
MLAATAATAFGQTVVGTLTRPGLVPRAVGVYEAGNKVFVADQTTGNLYIFDGATNAEIGSVFVGTSVQEILVHEGSGKLYVTAAGPGKLVVVNAATGARLLDYPGAVVGTRMAIDESLGKVYATLGSLKQIDVATDAITDIPTAAGNDLTVNPVTHEIFLTNSGSDVLHIVNGMTLGVTTISGPGGFGVAVSSADNKAYIAFCQTDGMGRPHACIYNRGTNTTTQVPDANDALRLFYNPASNRIYSDSEVDQFSTIIEGAADTSFNLPLTGPALAIGIRHSTNHVYYAGQNFIGALDDATQMLELIPVNNPSPASVVVQTVIVNQTTGRVYIINDSVALNFVTVIQDHDMMTRPPVYLGAMGFPQRIYILDPVTRAIVGKLDDSEFGFNSEHAMAVRPGGGRVYVPLNSFFRNEFAIEAGEGQRSQLTSFSTGGTNPRAVAVKPDNSRAYVSNSDTNNVSIIDLASNSVITTVTVGTTPWGVAITPDGSKLYVANRGSGNVSVINTATNAVITTIPVGSSPWGIAVNPAGTKVFVANSGSSNVSVIDAGSNTVMGTVMVGSTPHWLALGPDGKHVYVGNRGGGTVSIIDAGTNSLVHTATVGTNPEGVVALPNGNEVFVVNSNPSGASSLSIINTSNFSVSTVALPPAPSPGTNLVGYSLTSADPTSKFAGRVTSGGVAVSGALVRALQSGVEKGSAMTNAAGDYSIFNLKPGTYDIEVNAAGFDSQFSAAQAVGAGRTTILNFALCGYAISPTGRFFSARGGEASVSVTAPGLCSWMAASNASWIEMNSKAFSAGNGTISYVVRDNPSASPRQGDLTVAGHTFTVTQAGQDAASCAFTISPLFAAFSAAGGAGSINVTTTGECAWQSVSNVSWITITSNCCGIDDGAVTFTVAPNASGVGRSGVITVAGKKFNVKQK